MLSCTWSVVSVMASGCWARGQWSVVSGQRSAGSGQWAVASGQRSAISGQWLVAAGGRMTVTSACC